MTLLCHCCDTVFTNERYSAITNGDKLRKLYLIFIIPTNALISNIKLTLKLPRHVSMFFYYLQGAEKFCQPKLRIIELIKYNIAVCILTSQ